MHRGLLSCVQRYADVHADGDGLARTPVAGLTAIRATAPGALIHAVTKPLACLVLQGRKDVTAGDRTLSFGAGDSLLVTADVPTDSRIVEARADAPYLSLVVDLDVTLIAELIGEMGVAAGDVTPGRAVAVAPTDAEVADAAWRLMRMLDHPEAVPVLQAQLMREMHYWLLAGRHGPAIRRLGGPGSHAQRIARAVAVLRAEFDAPVPVARLASVAGMGVSAFHESFRAITSLSPLQFQKRLRLVEARRLMISDGLTASAAAFAVGYASTPQFTRDYGRVFGLPPARDAEAARRRSDLAA